MAKGSNTDPGTMNETMAKIYQLILLCRPLALEPILQRISKLTKSICKLIHFVPTEKISTFMKRSSLQKEKVMLLKRAI